MGVWKRKRMPRQLKNAINPLAPLLFFSLLIASCSHKSDSDEAVVQAMKESFESSNRSINRSTEVILENLEEKTTEFATMDRASIWFAKATKISKLSSEAFNYIEALKKLKEITTEKAVELYTWLGKYKEDILSIDSSIRSEFDKGFYLITNRFDTIKSTAKKFFEIFFRNTSPTLTTLMLDKLQNNIKVMENKIVTYCHHKIGNTGGGGFNSYATIVGQSSSYVKAGQEVKILAGIGAFSKAAMPKIIINGKLVELGDDGLASYKFKAATKPGKHIVPVIIDYTNEFGKNEVRQVNVQYTVAKECDQ